MNRLFAFGCSFTNYYWQTWVDSIADQFDEVQNWGMAGGGNQSISIRLTQCHKSQNITKDDTVLIMWTNIAREDKWSTSGWENVGNRRTNPQEKYKKVPNAGDLEWYALRDYTTIANTVWLLNHIGCKYEMYSMIPITERYDQYDVGPNNIFEKAKTIADIYGNELERIKPSVMDVLYNGRWPDPFGKNGTRDLHPLPGEHLKYMDLVSSYTPTEDARKRAYEQDTWIRNKIKSFGKSDKMLSGEELAELSAILKCKPSHVKANFGLQFYDLISYE